MDQQIINKRIELSNKIMDVIVNSGLRYRDVLVAIDYTRDVLRDKGNNLLNDTNIQKVAEMERFVSHEDSNKKPVSVESQTQCPLEKNYEKVLSGGTIEKVHISVSLSEYEPDDFNQVLTNMAECSHNFYLELGRRLNNKP